MIPVVRKRDIVRARPLSREEKKAESGQGDILIIEPSGLKRTITRKELLSRYTYLNGKRIGISGWRSSNEYMIGRLDNTNAYAMMVPLNCTVEIQGLQANNSDRKSADYIVALALPNGGVDPNTIGIIPSALFKKMYYIPPNDIITRNKGKGHKLFGKGPGGMDERDNGDYQLPTNRVTMGPRREHIVTKQQAPSARAQQSAPKQPMQFSDQLNIDTSQIDFGVEQAYSEPTPQVQGNWSRRRLSDISGSQPSGQVRPSANLQKSQNVQQTQPSQPVQQARAPYTAIGRLMNQGGAVVGFVIQRGDGRTTRITVDQMKEICGKHLVSNVMLTLNPATGGYYLRGNNMRLETLTTYQV